MNSNVLKEAIGAGFLGMFIGTIIGKTLEKMYGSTLPKVCNSWNKYYIMEISLFLTNFIIHIFCELVGLNRWYCLNGSVCQS